MGYLVKIKPMMFNRVKKYAKKKSSGKDAQEEKEKE